MNTPSHLIMTAALQKRFRHVPIAKSGFLLGSVAPDIALFALSIGGGLYYRYVRGLSGEATFRHMYDTMYFRDPLWMAAHNLLHAPLILLFGLFVCWRHRAQLGTWRHWLFWFFLACLFHTAIDIATHVDDGPLLFFPFEWTTRFQSPVSYWDRRYYGEQFALFELTLDVLLLGYLVLPVIWRGIRRRWAPSTPSQSE
jgi:hypothetical protein